MAEDMLKMFLSMGLVFGGTKLENEKVVLPVSESRAPKPEKKAESKKTEQKQ